MNMEMLCGNYSFEHIILKNERFRERYVTIFFKFLEKNLLIVQEIGIIICVATY